MKRNASVNQMGGDKAMRRNGVSLIGVAVAAASPAAAALS